MRLVRSTPYFPVPDVAAATRYYETKLGFRCEYSAGDPPMFAIVSRDGLGIMLRLVEGNAAIVPNERQGGTWDVFFWVDDVQALFDELSSNGAGIVYGPIVQTSYGMKEFAARDANGYVLGFGQEWA